MPLHNVYLSMLHGFIVGFGLILFSISAKYLPAAELILLSLVEVVGGILWVYLPILGIHEIPSLPTVAGGIIVLGAIVLDGVGVRPHSQISHGKLSLVNCSTACLPPVIWVVLPDLPCFAEHILLTFFDSR